MLLKYEKWRRYAVAAKPSQKVASRVGLIIALVLLLAYVNFDWPDPEPFCSLFVHFNYDLKFQ